MIGRIALALLLLISASAAHAQKRIALSFDDVPRDAGAFLTPDQRTEALIERLFEQRVLHERPAAESTP